MRYRRGRFEALRQFGVSDSKKRGACVGFSGGGLDCRWALRRRKVLVFEGSRDVIPLMVVCGETSVSSFPGGGFLETAEMRKRYGDACPSCRWKIRHVDKFWRCPRHVDCQKSKGCGFLGRFYVGLVLARFV